MDVNPPSNPLTDSGDLESQLKGFFDSSAGDGGGPG